MEALIPVYSILLGSSPMFVAAIVGIVMAALFWPRARQSAVLMIVACVLEILLMFAAAAMTGRYVPQTMHSEGISSIQHLMVIWGVLSSLLHAIVFGLLVWAAFAGRGHAVPARR
ncbi:hypothetical protein [Dyella sp. C11]|uniref:hypothetical protein n=1 Tax=Dyella sp. C11 TaxID=2126991 RepID=UPI000D659684|nr:hypothetical protein [Dyella sp. C11]